MYKRQVRASWLARNALAGLYTAFGDLKIRLGLDHDAIEPYEKQLALRRVLSAETKDPIASQLGLSVAETKLGDAYARSGQYLEGLKHVRPALAIDKELVAKYPGNTNLLRKLYVSYNLIAPILSSPEGSSVAVPGEAAEDYQGAISIAEKMAAADPDNRQPVLDFVVAVDGYADYLSESGHPADAVTQFRRSLSALEKLNRISPEAGGNIGTILEDFSLQPFGADFIQRARWHLGGGNAQLLGLCENFFVLQAKFLRYIVNTNGHKFFPLPLAGMCDSPAWSNRK